MYGGGEDGGLRWDREAGITADCLWGPNANSSRGRRGHAIGSTSAGRTEWGGGGGEEGGEGPQGGRVGRLKETKAAVLLRPRRRPPAHENDNQRPAVRQALIAHSEVSDRQLAPVRFAPLDRRLGIRKDLASIK